MKQNINKIRQNIYVCTVRMTILCLVTKGRKVIKNFENYHK